MVRRIILIQFLVSTIHGYCKTSYSQDVPNKNRTPSVPNLDSGTLGTTQPMVTLQSTTDNSKDSVY